MRLIDIFRIAISTFVHNKMRTFLTVFGVAIGIGAIVFLLSLGYGLQNITIGEISSMKALQTLNITSGNSAILKLDNSSLEKIKSIEGVESANESLSTSGQVSLAGSKTDVLINMVSAEFVDLESPRLEAGSLYTTNEAEEIIVTSVIAIAFGKTSSQILGETVDISMYITDPENTKNYLLRQVKAKIIGVIKDSVASYAYIPNRLVEVPVGSTFTSVKVKAVKNNQIESIKIKLTDMGYKVSSLGERIDQLNQVFDIVKIVLIVLGAIALFVASIGMFNTLTISLLERTKDIGIMKSLGATDGEIYKIFLAESTMIATFGGTAGLAIAIILGNIFNLLISAFAIRAGGESVQVFQIPIYLSLAILGFSVLVGFATGIYPARRAGKLNPLDALRYE